MATPRLGLTLAAALLAGAALAGTAQAQNTPTGAEAAAQQKASPVKVIRMYSHADGTTHFEELPLPLQSFPAENIQFGVILPGGPTPANLLEHHHAPFPRYVVTLSGSAEIEVTGGAKRTFVMDVNHMVLADDLTGAGHRYKARPLGNVPWVVAYLKLDMSKVKRDANGRPQ